MTTKLHPRQFLIEGIDRLGKSTLIDNIQNELGYHLQIHYDKPKKLKFYEDQREMLKSYQVAVYHSMFGLIDDNHKIIFDRAHLGEVVYSPLYRKYSGDYVYDLESLAKTTSARLILLTTSDFSFLKDDGLSLDFSKKEEEQEAFRCAYLKSQIADKRIIDVSNGQGGYRSAQSILEEALK